MTGICTRACYLLATYVANTHHMSASNHYQIVTLHSTHIFAVGYTLFYCYELPTCICSNPGFGDENSTPVEQ
jgi:NADH:ubiquinone oxidoreductase subunit 2 (subunit N)